MSEVRDVIVIGGGQAGLATGYYLRRARFHHSRRGRPAGRGLAAWLGLAAAVFAGGVQLGARLADAGAGGGGYPTRDEVIDYLTRYEARYALPVQRPVHVETVLREGETLLVRTDAGDFRARGGQRHRHLVGAFHSRLSRAGAVSRTAAAFGAVLRGDDPPDHRLIRCVPAAICAPPPTN